MLRKASWREKAALAGKLVDGRYHGLGIACFIEGGASGPRETARIEVEKDGTIAVYVGSSALGQGVETIMAQIAADALEIPIERIRVMHGSTTYLAEGFGSYGSRGTVMGGSAIVVAANALLEKFRASAAEHVDVAVEAVAVRNGEARLPDGRQVALIDLAEKSAGTSLAVDGVFSQFQADVHLRYRDRACRSRRKDRQGDVVGLCRGRRCRPHHQPNDPARPD